jgi:hypothetical protein
MIPWEMFTHPKKLDQQLKPVDHNIQKFLFVRVGGEGGQMGHSDFFVVGIQTLMTAFSREFHTSGTLLSLKFSCLVTLEKTNIAGARSRVPPSP